MRSSKQFAILAVLLAAPPAFATNGMRMIGFGPTQNAMGGVSVGAPLDAAVMATNPAGLTETGLRLDVGLTYFDPTVKYSATGIAPPFVSSSAEQTSDRGASWIPSVALAYPLGEKLVLGLGLFGVAGMGVDYKDPNLYGGPTKTSYLQARVTPSVAMKLPFGLSAGLTLNAMYATMEYDVAAGFGMVPRKSVSSMGYGATLGVLWKALDILTVGAAYETKSDFQDFEFDVPANNAFGNPFPGGKEKLAFDQPPAFTLGASVRPLPGFIVAADVEKIWWSNTNGKDMPKFSTSNTTGYLPWNMSWSDQMVYKLGVEFPILPTLHVRLGYNHGKMPLDADRAFENVAFPAVVEDHYTAGLRVKVGPAEIAAAAVYAPEAKLSGANDQPPPDGQGIASYTTRMSQMQYDLGASFSW